MKFGTHYCKRFIKGAAPYSESIHKNSSIDINLIQEIPFYYEKIFVEPGIFCNDDRIHCIALVPGQVNRFIYYNVIKDNCLYHRTMHEQLPLGNKTVILALQCFDKLTGG